MQTIFFRAYRLRSSVGKRSGLSAPGLCSAILATMLAGCASAPSSPPSPSSRTSAVQLPPVMGASAGSGSTSSSAATYAGATALSRSPLSSFGTSLPDSVRAQLDKAGVKDSEVGIYVQEIGASGPVLTLNPARPFVPASTMKVLTNGVALNALGPAYRWTTRLLSDGDQRGRVLYGNLYLAGSGDPKLTMENLWLLLRQLRARGIDQIQGNLVIDASRFNLPPFDAGEFDNDPLRPYNAGPDAALFNFATLTANFIPDTFSNTVAVWSDPSLDGLKIVPPTLGSGPCNRFPGNLTPVYADNTLTFRGTYSASCGRRSWTFHTAMIPSAQYLGAALKGAWKELGGTLRGQVTDGYVPGTATELASWRSAQLSDIIRDINKVSNNVMTRQVLLTLAAETNGDPATPTTGAEAVRSWLTEHGVNTTGIVIGNGSGLARNATVSPQQMGQALSLFFQSPYGPEFVSSLPIAGVDGTLAKRLTDAPVKGHAHMKTGTLRDVTAIAGYVQSMSGRQYVVVMLFNNPNTPVGRMAQDALVSWVYEKG